MYQSKYSILGLSELEPSLKFKLLLEMLACINECNIPAAILNGYNVKTHELGRDIDLLVKKEQIRRIIEICRAKANANGWPYVSGRWVSHWLPQGLYQIVFHRSDDGKIQNLAIDLIATDGVAAGVVPVYSSNLLDTDVEFHGDFPITPVGSYMKNLMRVLIGDHKGISYVEGLGYVPDKVKAYMASLLGNSFASYYENCVVEGKLVSEWRVLRRRAQKSYFLRHPLSFFKNMSISLVRRTVGWFIGHVTTVAVVGPDGVGKSTAIDEACHYLADAFITIRRRHWRPRLLPNISEIGSKKPTKSSAALEGEPSNAPRRCAGPFGALRLLYYYTDYVLGHVVKDRFYSSPDTLVNLYDRAALDMAVDPLRYGLRQSKVNLWIHRFSPKPDWIILLSDSPEAIYARKPELPYDEIARQIGLWTVLYERGFVQQIIQVGGRSADEVGRDIATVILERNSIKQDLNLRRNL